MFNIVHLVLYISIFIKYSTLASSVPRDYGEIKLFEAPVTYDLNTTVSLKDDKQEINYNVRATVRVEAAGRDPNDDFLLRFHLSAPALAVRGRAQRSAWHSSGDSEFFAHWSRGRVRTVYLDPSDPLDALNYKIAIISLFQFQVLDGDGDETDISGSCHVSYEAVSVTDVRKIKRRCGADSNFGPGDVGASVVALYSLQPSLRALRSVRLVEHLELDRSLRVHVEVGLEARGSESAEAAHSVSLAEAVRALPAALTARRLEAADEAAPVTHEASLERALTESGAALAASEEEAGGGGRRPAARAALRLLPALQAASASALLTALRAPGAAAVPALCRLLGLAGTAAAYSAVDEFLELAASEPPAELAAQYLAGAAQAPQPQPAAVRALLRLAGEARNAYVAAHALLAAAGAAPRASDPAVSGAVRDAALRGLARCKEDECRAVRLRALGNLRADDDAADVLLEHAARGGRLAALAALDGLGALPPATLDAHPPRRVRLEAVALRGGRPLEVRAAAVDLLLRRAAVEHLPRLVAGLRAAPHELRRLLWQRAEQLATADDAVRAALHSLPAADRSLAARAAGGTSAVLTRQTGWNARGRATQLDAVQVAAGGLLRRATVALLAAPAGNDTGLELEVSVWMRGLETVAGGSPDELAALDEGSQDAAGDASGGLALAVGGVRGPETTLFTGQAELLSHVWAGTGSTPTPVLRAVRVLWARSGRRRLTSGAALDWRRGAAAALALDAQAQVSLWSRNARLALQLRTAIHDAAGVELRVPGAGEVLRAAAQEDAEPNMGIVADLDFYEGMALCVRVQLADYLRQRNATLGWAGAGRGGRCGTLATTHAAGRTLALGRPNDRTCRTLGAPDPDH